MRERDMRTKEIENLSTDELYWLVITHEMYICTDKNLSDIQSYVDQFGENHIGIYSVPNCFTAREHRFLNKVQNRIRKYL